MRYPLIDNISAAKEMLTNFQGYDNRIGCLEGSFNDELNVTADHYPVLSARNKRHKASNDIPYNTMYDDSIKHYSCNREEMGNYDMVVCKAIPTTADRIINTSDGTNLISMQLNIASAPKKKPLSIVYNGKRVLTEDIEDFFEDSYNHWEFGIDENPNRQFVRMGSKLCLFPDKMWINIDGEDANSHGYFEQYGINLSQAQIYNCDKEGKRIDAKTESYYQEHPDDIKSGAYMISTNSNGGTSIKVYSDLTKSWSTVTTTHIAIPINSSWGIESEFKVGDGIVMRSKIDRRVNGGVYKKIGLEKILLTEDKDFTLNPVLRRGKDYYRFDPMPNWGDGDKSYYSSYFVIKNIIGGGSERRLIVTGILDEPISIDAGWGICIAREVPKMSYVIECQNRLWGCSEDGHEIYCCKLGDPTNWYCYEGTAADSYAATVGSIGEFTGAITYNQNPLFFKENSFLKVTVSASGAHSYRVQDAEGVEKYSARSIVNVEGILYYLNSNGVYAFDGSSPHKISDAFGNHRYTKGIGGKLNGKYYISVLENDGNNPTREGNCNHTLFVFDTYKGLWTKEADNSFIIMDIYCTSDAIYFTRLVRDYAKRKGYETWCEGAYKYWKATDDFFYGSEPIVAEEGIEEKNIEWYVESAPIGYALTNNKYVGKVNIRLALEIGAYVDFWMRYDNEESWTHIFNMSGKGTKSFTIPVTPRRCDTFRYRLSGRGDCKVISISKSIEEGSDV